MAASLCKMEYAALDPRVSTSREITSGAAHPAAARDEDHACRKIRDCRSAHVAQKTDRPARAPSLAEFAHDLCSPLTALAITARSLRDAGTSDGQSDDIESIIRISEQTLGALRDALDRARIDEGRDVPRTETCDLHRLVADVAEVSRPCAQVKNLEFIVRRDPACPRYVRTDASRLQRILINVLDNAVKYTAQGAVSLSLHFGGRCDSERVWLIFEILDTGIGIARKDQARIFKRFVRGSGAAGTNGSGLGLTIVSQLLHLMGGSIRVESEPGTGSSFRIALPVARAQEPEGIVSPAAPAKPRLPLQDLSALPYELRAGLREGLLTLDVSRIHKAIERIAEHNAILGAILETHANGYAFTGMFEAVSLGL